MNRLLYSLMVLALAAGISRQLHAQYVDCRPLFYFDQTGNRYIYTTYVPSQTFAVRMTPERAGRIDSAIIYFGIDKTPTTNMTNDTVIIKIYEDMLPNLIEIGSYVFSIPPNIQGKVPDNNWVMEFNFVGTGTEINPARDFWLSWRFSGPSADRARIGLRSAKPESGRSVVINGNGTTTPMTTVAWMQVGDTVDLQAEARICYVPIPVELAAFHASYVDGRTHLEWTTASETNNFGFEVERLGGRSGDGAVSLWQQMGFVPGNGTTTIEQRYAFVDEHPEAAADEHGVVRYRLRQIDYDGTTDVSPVQSVDVHTADGVTLMQSYPNPVSASQGLMTIPFTAGGRENARIEIRDVLGSVVAVAYNGPVDKGYHSVTFETTRLTPGMYSYTLTAGDKVVTRRFTVVR